MKGVTVVRGMNDVEGMIWNVMMYIIMTASLVVDSLVVDSLVVDGLVDGLDMMNSVMNKDENEHFPRPMVRYGELRRIKREDKEGG